MYKDTAVLDEVKIEDNHYELVFDCWHLLVPIKEFGDLVPKAGDTIVCAEIGRPIRYIEINGTVIRNKSDEQLAQEHRDMLDSFRREKEERFAKNGQRLRAQAKAMVPELAARIQRFEDESGDEFWIESGDYEMGCLLGADALIRKARSLFPDDTAQQIRWIEWWENLNTKDNNYNYKLQQALVPNFGEGHSGFTHSAAVGMAKAVINGEAI